MNNKTQFLLKYAKEGIHYDYEHEFQNAINTQTFIRGLYEHPKFSEGHLDRFINSNPNVGRVSTYRIIKRANDMGILKQHHIEHLFDSQEIHTNKQDVALLPGVELSPKIGHWMFDNGNIYNKTSAVKNHPSVARKVLDEIAASKHPDHVHPPSIWQETPTGGSSGVS